MDSIYSKRIVRLRAEGKSYSQISKRLSISRTTVQYWLGKNRKATVDRCTQDWQTRNPLAVKIRGFRYRAKKLGRKTDKFTQADFLRSIGGTPTCYITGKPVNLTDPASYSVDHILPLCRGGDGTLANAGLTIIEANRAKDTKTLDEFLAFCAEILQHHGRVVKTGT